MHANCCLGLYNKINGLRQALQGWKDYLSATNRRNMTWRSPDRSRGNMSNTSLIV
ncbi:BnaAnng19490D [Brassica napus]|uniref:BnaAnng19490D protein n=1 Tax=Brassica napus TaxID=3708 RepID=A0A078JDX1_BRANA|nr:BnaAnng19490D [Brassica napus]